MENETVYYLYSLENYKEEYHLHLFTEVTVMFFRIL